MDDSAEPTTWCYTVPKSVSAVDRYIRLSSSDLYYFEHPHRRQCIALEYSKVLDPVLLCQSLDCTITTFPKVGSRVVPFDGFQQFHLESEQIKLRVVTVGPDIISSMYAWCHAFQTLSSQAAGAEKPLFLAYLLRCKDEAHGCVLMAGFEHALGDAASYALFLEAWSDQYERLQQRLGAIPPAPRGFPPGTFRESAADSTAPASGLAPRRYRSDRAREPAGGRPGPRRCTSRG